MKHDVVSAARDSARLAALARTALLDSPAEESFDRLARLASRLLGAPIALVSLVAADRQFFKSCVGLGEPWATRREMPLSHSFCRHAIESAEPLVLEDAREHPLFRDNPAIADLGIVAYAGVPLITLEGHALGSFCVLDTQPRHWTPEQIQVLADLAASVMTEIRLREGVRAAQEQEAAESEARRQFEDLVQGLDAIVWEMDVASFRFTFVSQRAEHLLGYPAQRWIEEPTFWQDVLLHPEDRGWALDFCQTATRDSRDHEFEYRAVRADGETVWLRDLVRVVRDESGRASRLRGVLIDISEEKKAALELRKREAQLAEAQTLAHIGSWEVDIETDTLYWSDETYRLCGLEPQSVALSTEEFFGFIHADDRERVWQAIERVSTQGVPYCLEARIQRRDGSVRHAQLRGEAVTDPRGRPVRLRGTGQDITERKLAEEARLRAEGDARAMASRMRAVAEAASGVIGADSVDSLVSVLRDACKEVISFDCFYLCRYDEPAHALAFAVGYDSGQRVASTCIPAAGTPSERVIQTRRSILTHRASDPEARGAVPIGSGRSSESVIRVPVLSGDRVLGVLSVQSYTPELYTEQDIEVVEAIASLTATALVNIELLEELRASEESYRTIFDASHDAIYIHDLETGKLLDINRRCYEMHGYSREELLELGVEGVADGTPPYDAEHAAYFIEKAAAGEPQRFEWLARQKNGDPLWGDVYLQRVSIRGQDRLLATVRDITKRKHNEEARLEAERTAQGMASRMRAVAGAAAGVIGANSVEALQEVLREESHRVIPFDAFTMALYDPAEHTLTHLESYDTDVWVPAETVSAVGTPAERVIRSRRSLVTRHAADPEAAGAIPMGTGRRSESIIRSPILSGERVLGLISVQSYTPELYTGQDVEVLEAIASLAATALINLELSVEREAAEEALRQANEELEQRVAERTAELEQRTAELEAVFQALPDLYFRLAADGTVLDYRAGDEDRLLPPEQFLGRSLTDMLHDMPVDVAVRLRGGIEEVNRTGRLVCVEYPLSVAGVSCEFEARLLPLADGSLVAIVREITDRKQAERELQRREEWFRGLIENAHDMVFVIDGENRVIYVSPSVERILGHAPEELIGEIGSIHTDPDDAVAGRAAITEVRARPGHTVRGEFRVQHKDGSWRVLETYSRTLSPTSPDEGIVVNARDVTDRKQFDEALRRSEEHFRRLIENAHDFVEIVDLDGTTRYISPAVQRILGYAPEELIGTAGVLLADRSELEIGRAKLAVAAANPGTTVPGEFRARHKDGSLRVLETFARTLAPDSADEGIVINARDLTEHKQFEEALREREEWFRSLIENAHDMVQVIDADNTTLYVSPSVERLLGYEPEELLGKAGVLETHPDDVQRGVELLAQTVANPGSTSAGEFRVRHKDGTWRWLETYGRTLSPTSAEKGIVANLRDITERKQFEEALQEREEYFRSLIENAHDMVAVADASGRLVYVSPSARRVLGYEPEEMLGLTSVDLVHPDDLEITRQRLEETLCAPGAVSTTELRVRHKDGSYRMVESVARTLRHDSAEGGLIHNIRDITERYEAEQALRRSEEHFRRLTEMAYDMVMVIDASGRFAYTSPSVERILGYSAEDLGPMYANDLIHPDDREESGRNVEEILANPGVIRANVGRVRHKDGSYRIIESFARTLSEDTAEEGTVINARDITERKQFEEALRRSEEHFRRLIENAYDMVLVMDAAGTVTYASPSAQRVLGSAPEELTGHSGFSLVHPDDVDTALARTTETVATPGTVVSAELRLRHRDGSYRILETFCRTVADDSAASGIVVNARDATERKQFEEALQQSEARYRSLIENAHDIVTILDLEGRITYQSPQLERVLGYDPTEMLGQNALDFVHPEDQHLPAEALQQIFASPGATYISEYRFRHKDGSWRYLETFGRTLVPDSPEQGLVFNSRDVTERRMAEEELKRQRAYFEQLLASVDAGVAAWDAQGRFEYASPNAIPDPALREWIIGRTHLEYAEHRAVRREIVEQRQRSLAEAIESRRISEYEEAIQRSDGSPLHLLRRNRPVLNEAGEVERVIGYSVDITERKRTEEAVRRATEEAERAREAAERANRAKSEFLSRMSHELRTPMNSILGFAQLLDRAQLSPEHKKGVGHILKAGRHLLQLINEVLEIARIEAGRHSLSLEPVRLGTVLQEAVALVRPLAAQWRVELDDGPWPGCAVFVQADRQRLTQVLLNLLGNAIKYNRAGGRVQVTCGTEGEGPHLVVRVKDTGRGIAPEKADQLFTPFARLGAEQSEVEGTGLGLALSQRLTEAMGGSLTLESSGLEGSVFRLELQVTADPLQRLEDVEAAPISLDGVPHAPASLLYIEDNLANLSLVETILLSRPHWRTMPALQGQIGVELAREHLPDLILLDLHLPDISGEEVLRRLRSETRTASIPVVVITADATRSTVERLRAAGADAYLTKPLDIDEFLETVERFLPSPKQK